MDAMSIAVVSAVCVEGIVTVGDSIELSVGSGPPLQLLLPLSGLPLLYLLSPSPSFSVLVPPFVVDSQA